MAKQHPLLEWISAENTGFLAHISLICYGITSCARNLSSSNRLGLVVCCPP
ncbi:hypothetical protein Pan216_32770 [Planctomycetes bacterium Pan216]|uniref:Uncharacterized protein n=1 Tax=Kolteria novifilia TaxID=2527975 RepID=A0A518B610_9BACT|nr:hypothetical protein Pan216_32770 [Planctomycetes bacterium Pan216]